MTVTAIITINGRSRTDVVITSADGAVTEHHLSGVDSDLPISQQLVIPHGGTLTVGPETAIPLAAQGAVAHSHRAARPSKRKAKV